MKILFIINRPEFYYSHRRPLVSHMIKQGHICDVATGTSTIDASQTNGRVFSFFYDRVKFHNRSLRELKRIIQDSNPDTIVVFSPKLNLEVAITRPLQPVLYNFTGLGKIVQKTLFFKIYRIVFSLLVKRRDRLLAQNHTDQALLKNVTKEGQVLLVKGSGAPRQDHVANINNKRLLFVGRLTRDKGIVDFLELSKNQKFDSFELICIGGEDSAVSDIRIEELLLYYPKVQFRGNLSTNDLAEEYLKGGILVLPSLREGLPKVAIEASSYGLAMVLSNVPGCDEFACDIPSVQLFDLTSQEDLYEKIIKVSEVYNREQAGLIQSFFQNNFSFTKVLHQYELAITSLKGK